MAMGLWGYRAIGLYGYMGYRAIYRRDIGL